MHGQVGEPMVGSLWTSPPLSKAARNSLSPVLPLTKPVPQFWGVQKGGPLGKFWVSPGFEKKADSKALLLEGVLGFHLGWGCMGLEG